MKIQYEKYEPGIANQRPHVLIKSNNTITLDAQTIYINGNLKRHPLSTFGSIDDVFPPPPSDSFFEVQSPFQQMEWANRP